MTEKIYDLDSYIKEFDAKVIACKKVDDGYEILLDRTAFFPEEGGPHYSKGGTCIVYKLYGLAVDSSVNFNLVGITFLCPSHIQFPDLLEG